MSKNVTNHPKVIVEWKKALGTPVYAYRWRLDFYWFSFRVHKWLCSDDTRAFHSHPTNMAVFIVKGSYLDVRPEITLARIAPCFYTLRRDTKHYVAIDRQHIVWSLILTWGAPKRWAFWDKITRKKLNRDKYFKEYGHHVCE